VAEAGRYLAKDRGFLTVSDRSLEIGRIALDDITAVVATSPATTVSCSLLAELATRGIPFVLCGRNYAPAGCFGLSKGITRNSAVLKCRPKPANR
jgi:CRISPR-associated protein Cas1